MEQLYQQIIQKMKQPNSNENEIFNEIMEFFNYFESVELNYAIQQMYLDIVHWVVQMSLSERVFRYLLDSFRRGLEPCSDLFYYLGKASFEQKDYLLSRQCLEKAVQLFDYKVGKYKK